MSEKHRKRFAVLLFIIVFAFATFEVAMLFTSKRVHDVARAREDAEEISVELGMISSSFYSGDRALYERSYKRLTSSLVDFSRNDHIRQNYSSINDELEQYHDMLEREAIDIAEFLEMNAALNALSGELEVLDLEKLDAANFYQIQQAFQTLRDSLAKIGSKEYENIKKSLDGYANEIIKLAQSSATCISVCPKKNFSDKLKKLSELKTKYEKEFETLGDDVSKKYDPSSLIVRLGDI
ncbi:hypothetical protein IK110_00185 [Candidatus Saccharibacteria bacterium]|nr:hypothetical protein [Candidatus Saccharibacteria bacterium]